MTTLDELEKLLAAATPGPWHVGHNELGDPQGPMSIWPDPGMVGAVIARCGPQGMSQGWFEQPAKDAALIVAAVNALPELLARLERLEAFKDAVIGWRETDWPEWFHRWTAEQVAQNAERRAALQETKP